MRLLYKLRGITLALWVGACGRIDVDLLPEGEHIDPPLDAQARIEVEDAAVANNDDVGVGVIATDAATGGDFDASGDGSASILADGGSLPVAPNVPVATDAAVGAAADAGTADAGAADAATADAATAPPSVDAATPAVDGGPDAAARDAGTVDSGAPDASADAAIPPCAGKTVLGLCWYLGSANASCNAVCSTHGGFDTNANGYVGSASQGGSLANCQQVLSALGTTTTALAGMRSDRNGVGCHLWSDGQPWWLDSPAATPDSAIPEARIACGCTR